MKFLFTTDKPLGAGAPRRQYAAGITAHLEKRVWHIWRPSRAPGSPPVPQALTHEQARAAAVSGEIEGLLQWFEARPGDTFFIPAGTVHAIGGGLALCEIQQNSDVTYRLYDYGRPRELHLDQALAVSSLGPHAARRQPLENVLVSCRHFATECVGANRSTEYQPFADRAHLLIAIEGVGEIAGQPIRAGEVWHVLPASDSFQLSGNLRLLRVYVPPA